MTPERPRTEEFYLEYDSLTQRQGEWTALGYNRYQKFDTGTWFVQLQGTNRSGNGEGASVLGVAGAYKDWNPWFFTYTAVSTSTNSQWTPRFRVDQDFNFKVGPKRSTVLTAGLTNIWYHQDPRQDFIYSGGITQYFGQFNVEFRHFWNTSNPGNVGSQSNSVAVGYDNEGDMRASVTYGWGREAYLGSLVVSLPPTVSQRSSSWMFTYRKWTSPTAGFFVTGQWINVAPGYALSGGQAGYFHNF